MIGCLLYLAASRSDIAYVVGVYARFQSDPRVSYLVAVKELSNMFMVVLRTGKILQEDVSLYYPVTSHSNPLNTSQELAPITQNQLESKPISQPTDTNVGELNKQTDPNDNAHCIESDPKISHTQKKLKKPTKGPQVVSTKIGRRKLSPTFHLSPLMEFHFTLRKVFNVGIVKAGLSKTILIVGPFYPRLIREFIVNLPSEFNDPSSLDYQTIHIREAKFKISPSVINSFLGNIITFEFQVSHPSNDELASVLFGGTLSAWSVNGIPAASLSVKFAILHKIGIAN
ncbi:uncharacterized protein E5676_scaffold104G00230 [Cucumis melo var. makuwa]|uniref:Putative plant transposon protein domain-containing protein n=1 Tax=Cucumis melo var. makuwa TaxID=1194695 RepID=A0A5A7UM10_CUCMM|nr:uncharacterized protein E6C27_scaffold24G005430 [Cucumis melo var. makuwa]TYJ95607.1 uncharacterized protein E5676_scaffold104G00230 [Cucumis melo var. makuwa]